MSWRARLFVPLLALFLSAGSLEALPRFVKAERAAALTPARVVDSVLAWLSRHCQDKSTKPPVPDPDQDLKETSHLDPDGNR